MKLKRLLFVSSCLILATAGIMTETTPFNSECRECHAFPICSGGCAYYRLRNYKDDAKFTICSQYKDNEKLRRALLAGIKPEFA